MWIGFEFVVDYRLCSERYLSGYSSFSLSSKTNISIFQFDVESVPILQRAFVHLVMELCAIQTYKSYCQEGMASWYWRAFKREAKQNPAGEKVGEGKGGE